MSDREVTVDLVAMFRQNTDAMLRAAACIGIFAAVNDARGHTEQAENAADIAASIAAVYEAITGEDAEDFINLMDITAQHIMEAAQVSSIISRDKLNA